MITSIKLIWEIIYFSLCGIATFIISFTSLMFLLILIPIERGIKNVDTEDTNCYAHLTNLKNYLSNYADSYKKKGDELQSEWDARFKNQKKSFDRNR